MGSSFRRAEDRVYRVLPEKDGALFEWQIVDFDVAAAAIAA